MTFVAQPYEMFVDDLLTSLTGGMAREEHQFISAEPKYSLATPGALPETVKVFGQRADSSLVFEGGVDYDYDVGDGVVSWRTDGRVPDDRSYFYINYYTSEGRRRLTDRNPGSVTTTLAESFAREFAVVHKQMEMIYRSGFVDLATGSSLEHVAALLSLTRKDAKFAGGEVLFKRSTPADGDINIPSGAVVSTDDGQNFETTDRRTLRRGQLSVVVPVSAQAEGPAGRVAAQAIKNINRPIFGIETVANDAPTFFATAKETDEELRRRIKGTLERAGKSTSNSLLFSLIEEVPGLNEGNVQVAESREVPGKVDIKFGLGGAVDPDLVRRIEETIFDSRAAGVRVGHNLPTRSAIASQGGLVRADVVAQFRRAGAPVQTTDLGEDLLSQMPEGIVVLQIETLVRMKEANLSATQKENIEDQVRTALLGYIDSLPMGADVIYSKMLGSVVALDEVSDAILMLRVAPPGGVAVEKYQQNIGTSGRKATAFTDGVFVGLMEENINIDAQVTLAPWPAKTADSKPATLSTAEQNTVTDALHNAIETAEGALQASALKDLVTRSLSNPDAFQVTVVMNAEYEETGRLLYATDRVTAAGNELFHARNLSVQVKGALDG